MSFLSTHRVMTLARTVSLCKHFMQVNPKFPECSSVATGVCSNKYGRFYSEEASSNKSVSKASASGVGDAKPITFKEKVKENTKTTGYGMIMLGGLGVTAVMFYAIFRELFSSKSPNSVYSAALQRCADDTRVVDTLGAPVKGHGEETRRGRRRHVSHVVYEQDGVNHMRMKFYVDGSRQSGTVYLDVRESPETGKYEYRYLFVEVDASRRVIVLEDNRASEPRSLPALPPLKDYSQPRSEA